MAAHDVLIIGGGVAGLSTAWHLSRRAGFRVRLLEREGAPGRMATAQNAAILRTFGLDPLTNAIARRGAEFLRRPPTGFAPVALVDRRGFLLFVGAEQAQRTLAVLERDPEHGALVRAPREVADLTPYRPRDCAFVLHFREEGQIELGPFVQGLASGAQRAGAEISCGRRVQRLLVEGSRVVGVVADGDVLRADTVVLAAGAWVVGLARAAGSAVELRPTRRHLLVTQPDDRIRRDGPIFWDDAERFYGRPRDGGLLLCACDGDRVEDPDDCNADPRMAQAILGRAAGRLPSLERTEIERGSTGFACARLWHGLRTLTADGRFAVGPDPDLEGLFWVAGLGGHGMTCGAEVGRLAAAGLAGDAEGEPCLGPLAPSRLARSRV